MNHLFGALVLGLVRRDGSSTGVGLLRPGGCPSHDRGGAVRGEVLVEHGAVPVCLLGVGDVTAPFGLGVLHHLVRHVDLGVVLERVNPAVSDTVRELLLLSPEDLIRQVGLRLGIVRGIEGLAQDVLLDVVLGDHLRFGVDVHASLQELQKTLVSKSYTHSSRQDENYRPYLLVQERHTSLETPSGSRLVGTQAVSQVQVLDTAHRLLVESLLVWGSMEVQVSTKDLVATLTTEDHLDTHGLDLARKEVHGSRGTDRGNIVGLQVVDDIGESVEAVLDGEGHDVVLGSEELGNLEGGLVVRRAGQTNGEGVELGEVGHCREIVVVVDSDETLALVGVLLGDLAVLDSLSLSQSLHSQGFPLCNGGDERRVQTTGQEDTVRHLSHESLPDGLLQGLADGREVQRGLWDLGAIPPRRLEIPVGLASLGVVDVARREGSDLVADGVQALQLRGEIYRVAVLAVPALVETGDTHGVAGCDRPVELLVVQHEGEHAVQVLGCVKAILHIQRNNDLAVRMRLEVVGGLQGLSDQSVVVDFAVDGKDDGVILVGERLSTGL